MIEDTIPAGCERRYSGGGGGWDTKWFKSVWTRTLTICLNKE